MNDDDDDDKDSGAEGAEEYVSPAEALQQSGFTMQQLRSLVSVGLIKTRKRFGGKVEYCVEDLQRLVGLPRVAEPEELTPMAAEFRAVTDGYKQMLELALKQTKQAQDHERQLITAFSKPLENLGDSSKSLVTAVLDQNKQLVQRANDGDSARLDFVKAAESMLRDQRTELREQAELDRKHELRREVWAGVKKAAPELMRGLRLTAGGDRLEAAEKLKATLDPAKIAAIIRFQLIDSEQIDLLCTALGLDRAELEKLNAEADAAEAAAAATDTKPTEPPPRAEQAAE